MHQMRSIYNEQTGSLVQRTASNGVCNLLDVQNLTHIRVALRGGTKVYPIPAINFTAVTKEVGRRWNETKWPELAGAVFMDFFKGRPMSVVAAHMFEQGFFMGMMYERMMRKKDLSIDAENLVISADEMQQMLDQIEKETKGDG